MPLTPPKLLRQQKVIDPAFKRSSLIHRFTRLHLIAPHHACRQSSTLLPRPIDRRRAPTRARTHEPRSQSGTGSDRWPTEIRNNTSTTSTQRVAGGHAGGVATCAAPSFCIWGFGLQPHLQDMIPPAFSASAEGFLTIEESPCPRRIPGCLGPDECASPVSP